MADGRSTRGIITLSGKWSASSPPASKRRPIRAGMAAASDIAATRPGMVVRARYSGTTVVGRPSPAAGAMLGTKTVYSSSPTRASVRQSSRAYVSEPPTSPGTSVSRLSPTRTARAYLANDAVTDGGYDLTMPDGGVHDGASAQASPSAEVDPIELFERLREEIRRGGSGPEGERATWRAQAERMWPVSAERPLVRRPGLKGAVAYPVKRFLRPLLRWYVEPLAAEQRAFNDAVLQLVGDLYETADRRAAGDESSRRMLTEVDERLRRVERRGAGSAPAPASTVAVQPAAAAVPDYFGFEARMRGSTAAVRERQRPYVDDFRDSAPVLDVGCGRGEFLALLRDAGVDARGIDADADMVAYARGEGLEVEQADALAYLEALSDGSLGGIFAAQVVEHLPPGTLVRMLEL